MSDNPSLEIERRFRIQSDIWKNFVYREIEITQGYWLKATSPVVLKITDQQATLRFKKGETEWFEDAVTITPEDAQHLQDCCDEHGIISPQEATIRIRTYGEKNIVLTVKKRLDDIACVEIEYDVPFKTGLELLAQTDVQIVKTRHLVGIGNQRTAEVDVFRGLNAGFACVEIEFNNHEEAMQFIQPSWFGTEIANHEKCSNKALAITPWLLR